MDDDATLCTICGKPVVLGEPIYSITGNHYDCERPPGTKTFKESYDDTMKALDRLEELVTTRASAFKKPFLFRESTPNKKR